MTSQRAYVCGLQPLQLETHTQHNVFFRLGPERALAWQTREDAERERRNFFDGVEIKIPAIDDRVCKNFRVEERARNEFVILCDYPA